MDINTPLPESGLGFVTNNRGAHGEFQFGQQSTIDACLAVAREWSGSHPHPFSIGQISKKGGGVMPPHQSHKLGVDVDVRPVRKDGLNSGVTIADAAYDRAATTALIELWWQKAPVQLVLFNDQKVIDAGLSRAHPGHGNHFHVRLRMKGATVRIRDRGSDVAELQAKLGLSADGRFGPATLEAVEEFQAAHGLVPDGVVNSATWKALG